MTAQERGVGGRAWYTGVGWSTGAGAGGWCVFGALSEQTPRIEQLRTTALFSPKPKPNSRRALEG